MTISRSLLALSACGLLAASPLAFAAPHSYQVTGPITEMTDTSITVMKGTEKWEIAKDATTKVTGDLKVGGKVTIEYFMTATTVTSKDKAAPAAAPVASATPAAPAAAATPAPKKKAK